MKYISVLFLYEILKKQGYLQFVLISYNIEYIII